MAKMAQYCKAYYVKDLRKFAGWTERLEELRIEKEWKDGKEHEIVRTALADDDVLYLQPGLQVTDGIFEDEHIVFRGNGSEWEVFCREVLKFEVPEYAKPVGTDVPTNGADTAEESQSANA